jgi:hypothetical protein
MDNIVNAQDNTSVERIFIFIAPYNKYLKLHKIVKNKNLLVSINKINK